MTDQRIQQDAICYQWFKQRLILSVGIGVWAGKETEKRKGKEEKGREGGIKRSTFFWCPDTDKPQTITIRTETP